MDAVRVVSVAEMRAIEQEADARGITYALMMQRAGEGVARIVQQRYHDVTSKVVLGLVGSGNNGGGYSGGTYPSGALGMANESLLGSSSFER